MAKIREKKKQQTRKAILEAAVRLFGKKGYEKTSIDQLAKEAGIGKGTVYGYFQTKSEIFLAFCKDEIEFAYSDLAVKTDARASLADQLVTLFMGQFRYVTRNPDFGRILAREMIFPKEITLEKSKNLEEKYLQAMADILEKSKKRGELKPKLNLYYTTAHFYALYVICLSSWYAGRLQDEIEMEDAMRTLIAQALEGLTPAKPARGI